MNKDTYEAAFKMLGYYREKMEKLTLEAIRCKYELPGTERTDHSPILDSLVLNQSKDMFQKIKFIFQSLDKAPKDFKLLYRASDYNFSSGTFHEICDHIPDTLTLVRTEHGKTIARYTHYPWGKAGKGDGLDHRKKLSFLLQLDHQEKLVPVCK